MQTNKHKQYVQIQTNIEVDALGRRQDYPLQGVESDKKWQGFIRDGVDVTIDLGEEKEITEVTAQFMQMCIPDVWFPAEVIISTSCDGNVFNEQARSEHTVVRDEGLSFKEYGWKGNTKARYINYRAKCGPQRGWLFTDEIIVK